MEDLINEIMMLVDSELQRANDKYPAFNSNHEGVAVIDEEIGEMAVEVANLIDTHEAFKQAVYSDDSEAISEYVDRMQSKAILGCAEMIQALAMMVKFVSSRATRKKNGEGWEEEKRPY